MNKLQIQKYKNIKNMQLLYQILDEKMKKLSSLSNRQLQFQINTRPYSIEYYYINKKKNLIVIIK